MTDTKQVPSLSDDQLQEMIGLLRGADSAELKLTVPDEGQGWRSTVAALGMDPMEAFLRQVFFFDTPDLDLDRRRCCRPRPPHAGQARRLGGQAAAGSSR